MSAEEDLEKFKEIINYEAETLIKTRIPEKIVILNKLIEDSLHGKDLSSVYQPLNIVVPVHVPENPSLRESGHSHYNSHNTYHHHHRVSRRYRASASSRGAYVKPSVKPSAVLDLALNEAIPCNKSLCDLIFLVKPHVKQLLVDTDTLKMWINFMIPKLENGNNFGVEIQEMVLKKIGLVEKFAFLLFNYTSMCFMARAEIVNKVATFPHINDYRRAVMECDENSYRSFCKMLCQIRDFYCSLHDVVAKNMDRIKNPRVVEINSMCI